MDLGPVYLDHITNAVGALECGPLGCWGLWGVGGKDRRVAATLPIIVRSGGGKERLLDVSVLCPRTSHVLRNQ